METMYIHRAGTEQRVLMPDEIRDINNRRIRINSISLAPKLHKQAMINQMIGEDTHDISNVSITTAKEYSTENKYDSDVSSKIERNYGATSSSKMLPFIEANTKEVSVSHLRNDCIIPVFSKDNEVTISHHSFIEAVHNATNEVFRGERIGNPEVRVSHIIKGRIPEAMNKPVSQLLETDKTIYYERMMFCIEIPTIHEDISGNRLNLTIGGVRAYNNENLYSRKTYEKFKVFIGFKNMVCCNMCVSTDGYKSEIRAMSLGELNRAVTELFKSYSIGNHLDKIKRLQEYYITEAQFAQFLGRSRMYQYLPNKEKKALPEMMLTDSQINLVTKAYYNDKNFGRKSDEKELSMWKMYNLLTGANKSSYIDNFLDRSLNAEKLTSGICKALTRDNDYSWFIK